MQPLSCPGASTRSTNTSTATPLKHGPCWGIHHPQRWRAPCAPRPHGPAVDSLRLKAAPACLRRAAAAAAARQRAPKQPCASATPQWGIPPLGSPAHRLPACPRLPACCSLTAAVQSCHRVWGCRLAAQLQVHATAGSPQCAASLNKRPHPTPGPPRTPFARVMRASTCLASAAAPLTPLCAHTRTACP